MTTAQLGFNFAQIYVSLQFTSFPIPFFFILSTQAQAYSNFKQVLPRVQNLEKACDFSKKSIPESCFNKLDAIDDYILAEDEMRKSMIRLDVYFKSMTTSRVTEERKYTVSFSKKSLNLD